MGKQSGGTKKGSSANPSGNASGGIKKQIASYQKDYVSNIESDFKFDETKGVVGQLIGNSIQKEVDAIIGLLNTMPTVDTYTKLDKFISDVERQFGKSEYNLDDKISIIEQNMQGVIGKAKTKYSKAKDEINSIIYELRQLRKKYAGSDNLVKFSEFLLKNKIY